MQFIQLFYFASIAAGQGYEVGLRLWSFLNAYF